MVKLNKSRILVGFWVATLLLSIVPGRAVSAASSFTTEARVKNALYAIAAYTCIDNSAGLQDTAIGNKKESVLPLQVGDSEVYVGQWLGDEDGMITCRTALTKTLGTGNITEDMLRSGKIFNGVYERDSGAAKKLKCGYGIVNSSGKDYMDGQYYWPQGYVKDPETDEFINKRDHGIIELIYNERGPIGFEGPGTKAEDVDEDGAVDDLRNTLINWDAGADELCKDVVMAAEIYTFSAENLLGEETTFRDSVLSTDDPTPFNEWGPIHVHDEYHAWLHSDSRRYECTATPVSSNRLKLKNDAKSKLLSNLSREYLGGATSAEGFLNSNADAKYILYGRYLFNGDGNAGFACGGISVATNDPQFSELTSQTDFWHTTQPYVASVSAYRNGSASTKSSYRTKFGGNGIAEAGSAKNINFPGVSGNCKEIAGQFNNVNPSASSAKLTVSNYMKASTIEELPEENTNVGGDTGDAGGTTDTTPPCFSSAESLGWIICPVIKGLSKALNGIYGYVESNFLMINSSLMANDGGLHTGWTQFRDIANIVFVILIVLVILSQVTGIGISNYGIKKVLPRLIAVAILANLSFIICQLAVDATNLLGVGLRQMFNSQSADLLSVTDFTTDLTTVLFSSAATTGVTAIAAVAAVHTWDLWLPAVLLFLFTTIISVLFFAVILGVRQAGIIILIALAPAAIVCYALPNTQKLFDRWFKLFTSLLLVFPICGILMGGGIYASNLMLAAANNAEEGAGFFFTLVAMLMQVVPFFLVPGLVKGSLALAGNIGTRISNFGSRLGTGLERGVRRSDGFQDMQERLRAQNAQRFLNREQWRQDHRFLGAPGRAIDRIGSGIRSADNRFGRAAQDRYDRRRARAAGVYRKYQMDRIKAQAAPRGFTAVEGQRLLAAEEAKQLNEMTANDEFSIKSNQDFMSNISTQGESAYTAALDALRANPTDQNAIAHVRALQNVLSSTDPGREVIQNTLNRQLFDAQSSGNTGSIDQGLLKASNYLMEDHGGFKNENRGLYSMIGDLQQGNATEVFGSGGFKSENGTIRSHYDSKGTDKLTSSALANADEAALKRYVYAAQNNMMDNNDLTQLAATATDALTNRNIDVKPEYEKYLNDIRQASYDKQKSSFTTDHAGNYFDDNGREFVHTTGDKYQYTDSSGTAHEYTRDAQGNFMSANGTDVVGADRITNAVQEFNIRNGSSHQDLRNNDRLDIPKRERRAPQKIQSDYYRSSVTGQWMNRSTGNPLTAQEIVRAEAYQRYNDNIDNHNTLNPTSGNP